MSAAARPPAQWRQADPEDRDPGRLERRDGIVDAPDISLAPGVGAEFVGPDAAGARRLGARRPRLRGAGRGSAPSSSCEAGSIGFAERRNRRLRAHRLRGFPDLLAIVEADHHHHEFRLLGRDHFLGRLRPIGIFAARVVPHLGADQAGRGAMPAQDADFRRVGEGLLEPIGEPIRHRIAEHHDRRLRRPAIGLLRRRRLGIVHRRRAILPLGGIEPVAAAVPAEERETVVEQLRAGRRRRDHQQRRHRGHFRGDQDDGGQAAASQPAASPAAQQCHGP